MILKRFFQRGEAPSRRLYGAIVAAARHPAPYQSWGVADTLDGRFDMIVVHMYLVLARLKGETPELRQALVDEFFADMDRSLREMGVGDLSVGKKVRRMAEAFYGRIAAYDQAMAAGGAALVAAIARNFFPDGGGSTASERLSAYMTEVAEVLAGQDRAAIADGVARFPEPVP
jgi:cytochrome b pre-mRNA-processing protein 3